MTHYDSEPEETEDRFYAQFDSREVKLMTLDELVEAFEAGEIHENTFVCREGESEWLTLSVVAGLGDDEEEQAAPEPVAERRPPMPNRVPASAGALETRPPMPNRAPDLGGERRPPMPNRAPANVGAVEMRPPMPNRRPEMNTVPASRRVTAYPSVAPPLARVAPSTPLSFAPVTSNINYADLDLDELALRPKRRAGRVFGVVAALALVGGGGAFVATGGMHRLPFVMPSLAALESAAGHSQASLTASNIDPKPSTPAPVAAPAPAAPTPEPVAVTPPAPSDSPAASDAPVPAASATPQFSDDMKEALLAADKSHAAKHAAKVKGRSAPSSVARRSGGNSTGFKSGGSAYDPLNGKL
jgi:hypothetical protein